jgi:DNA-binding MarR family transcriptional regulator
MEKKIDHGWGRLPRLLARYRAKLKLSQYEGQVYSGIQDFLTGHSRKWDTISLTQLADITKIDRRHISDIVKRLVKKKAIEVKENRYRLIFYEEIGGTSTSAPFEIGDTWTGKEYTKGAPLQDQGAPTQVTKGHLSKTKGHPHRCPPKTLSKDLLRFPPKKEKIFTKLSEEEIEKNKKKALDIVEELKKKYGEV